MLHKFKLSNFKSFRGSAEINFVASKMKEHEAWVARDVSGERILKVIAVFGGNGAGKSNVVGAFAAMQRFINLSLLGKSMLSVWSQSSSLQPFAFSDKEEPSSFEVVFSLNDEIYRYGFCANGDIVLEEYLYVRDKNSKQEQYKTLFFVQEEIVTECADSFLMARKIFKKKGRHVLFLCVAISANICLAENIYGWFSGICIMDYSSDWMEGDISQIGMISPLVRIITDNEKKARLMSYIKALDLGIDDIEVEKLDLEEEDGDKYQIITHHKNNETGKVFMFPLIQESGGTKKLIALFEVFDDVLTNGKILFIDELDAKLHPLVLQKLLSLFRNNEINTKNSQLIFVSKDIFNLNRNALRRDEILFVEKDKANESSLYSLCNIAFGKNKVRNDASFAKDYISGKYGALPGKWQ